MTTAPIQTFPSVWDALEETPEAASNRRLRAELAIALRAVVEAWHITQADAAPRTTA